MWNFEFNFGDEVVLSVPKDPRNEKEFLAGWADGMDEFVGKVAKVIDVGTKHVRDHKEIETYRVTVDGLRGKFWWDSDYMHRFDPLVYAQDPGLEQSFDLVFG